MKCRVGAAILAAAFLAAAALPAEALAGRSGRGGMGGPAAGNPAGGSPMQQMERIRTQDHLRLQNGFGAHAAEGPAGTMERRGNTYGPGDGTGNGGERPTDGTGYGAPSQR